jgi:hypothetical protein
MKHARSFLLVAALVWLAGSVARAQCSSTTYPLTPLMAAQSYSFEIKTGCPFNFGHVAVDGDTPWFLAHHLLAGQNAQTAYPGGCAFAIDSYTWGAPGVEPQFYFSGPPFPDVVWQSDPPPLAIEPDAHMTVWTLVNGAYIALNKPSATATPQPLTKTVLRSQISDEIDLPDGTKWVPAYNGIEHVTSNGYVMNRIWLPTKYACWNPRIVDGRPVGRPTNLRISSSYGIWFQFEGRAWLLDSDGKLGFITLPAPDARLEAAATFNGMIFVGGKDGDPMLYFERVQWMH